MVFVPLAAGNSPMVTVLTRRIQSLARTMWQDPAAFLLRGILRLQEARAVRDRGHITRSKKDRPRKVHGWHKCRRRNKRTDHCIR